MNVRLALTEQQALALTMWGEARGDNADGSSVEERIAVGCVIRNRVLSGRWAADYKGTCLQPLQFSCWNEDGSANAEALLARATALVNGDQPDPLMRECLFLAEGIIHMDLLDRTHGATHYVTRALLESHPPSWLRGVSPVATVGSQVFFRL